MTLMEFDLHDLVGVFGSLLIAAAYFSVSNRIVSPDRPLFHLINLVGSLFILYSLYFKPNTGAILMEVLWFLIALTALIKFLRW